MLSSHLGPALSARVSLLVCACELLIKRDLLMTLGLALAAGWSAMKKVREWGRVALRLLSKTQPIFRILMLIVCSTERKNRVRPIQNRGECLV